MSTASSVSKVSKVNPPVVGIGASAGGLEAFKKFLTAMPTNSGLAFVLIQHLDPTHESMMVELLSHYTTMKVIEAEDNMEVIPNTVYMIPPNKNLAIDNNHLILTVPTEPRGKRMAIDFFFRSLAKNNQETAICIILSGTGTEGTLGLKEVKNVGGMVMTQEPSDAQFDGMPVSAISTGMVDFVLRVEDMPNVLLNYIKHPYMKGHLSVEQAERISKSGLYSVLNILQTQLGYNFHHYKRSTLIRRVMRRMGLKQIELMPKYAEVLKVDKDETTKLFKDLLIGVTTFFREMPAWEVIKNKVIPKIIERKQAGESVRVWIPGCSTGEEAYSMAILLLEAVKKSDKRLDIQIFASDIDPNALEVARAGRYLATLCTEIPKEYLETYFSLEDGFYIASGQMRDLIVFSEQNLISDPPFSKIDLIACRNLLIYLQSEIQQRVISLFHFSLIESGFLFLGNSESIGTHTDLFRNLSKTWRIFSRIDTVQSQRALFPILSDSRPLKNQYFSNGNQPSSTPFRINSLAQSAILGEISHTIVIINFKQEVLFQLGDVEKYLKFTTGIPSNNLFDLCREGLVTRLRGAVHKSKRDNIKVHVKGARINRNGKYERICFSIYPLSIYEAGDGLFMIRFEDEDNASDPISPSFSSSSSEESQIIKQLEFELLTTKEDLHNTIEELEASNEELKTSNEEVMSINEELQSSNEELETSKEELQSLNEELNTVNNELQEKISTLETTNNDLTNLMNSTDVASVFLDLNMHVRFFTPATKTLFALIASDVGRFIGDITRQFNEPKLLDEVSQVIDTLNPARKQIKADNGNFYDRIIHPYRTQDNRIEGVVITFNSITRDAANKTFSEFDQETFKLVFDYAPISMILIDKSLEISRSNATAKQQLNLRNTDLENKNILDIFKTVSTSGHNKQSKKETATLKEILQNFVNGPALEQKAIKVELKNKIRTSNDFQISLHKVHNTDINSIMVTVM